MPLNELADRRRTIGQQELWASGLIDVLRVRVDPQHMKDRRHQMLGLNRFGLGDFGFRRRFTHDLSHLQAAAGQRQRAERPPVVSASHGIDARRAAELAGDDQQNFFRQAVLLQVFQKRGDGVIERRTSGLELWLDHLNFAD